MSKDKTTVFEHTEIPTERKAHMKPLSNPDDGTAMVDAELTKTLAHKNPYAETDWIELSSGYKVKWIRVPPMLYNEVQTRIRKYMRDNRPNVPAVKREGNSPIPNPNDRYYQEAMEVWDEAYEDLDIYLRSAVPIMSGLILKDDIPPEDEWLPQLIGMLRPFGVTKESIMESPYHGDPTLILELAFKKYVVLSDPDDLAAFTRYQAGDDSMVAQTEAVDMFRPDSELPAARRTSSKG